MPNNRPLYIVLKKVGDKVEKLSIPKRVAFVSELARQAAQQSAALAGLSLPTFPKSDKGAPLPVNGVFWSLTHKTLYVAGAASIQPLGIDLEHFRPVAKKIYDKVAVNKEWQLAINAGLTSQMAFFMVWTAKEAVLKRIGTGLAGGGGLFACTVKAFTADTAVIIYAKQEHLVQFFTFDNHIAAICADGNPAVFWNC